MVLGNMDVGLNTQNLMAVLMVIFLSVLNIFGVKTGAAVQNVFTFAKTAALLGLVLLGVFVGRNAAGDRRQLRRKLLAQCRMACAASGAGGSRRADRAGGNDHHHRGGAGGVAVLRRRVEQRYVHRR